MKVPAGVTVAHILQLASPELSVCAKILSVYVTKIGLGDKNIERFDGNIERF